jgi:hypothetical protein
MREISRCGEVLLGIGGRLAIGVNNNYITRRRIGPNHSRKLQKESGHDPKTGAAWWNDFTQLISVLV